MSATSLYGIFMRGLIAASEKCISLSVKTLTENIRKIVSKYVVRRIETAADQVL